jgi:hypothetical protein
MIAPFCFGGDVVAGFVNSIDAVAARRRARRLLGAVNRR